MPKIVSGKANGVKSRRDVVNVSKIVIFLSLNKLSTVKNARGALQNIIIYYYRRKVNIYEWYWKSMDIIVITIL